MQHAASGQLGAASNRKMFMPTARCMPHGVDTYVRCLRMRGRMHNSTSWADLLDATLDAAIHGVRVARLARCPVRRRDHFGETCSCDATFVLLYKRLKRLAHIGPAGVQNDAAGRPPVGFAHGVFQVACRCVGGPRLTSWQQPPLKWQAAGESRRQPARPLLISTGKFR
eukprot:354470-Chlamydomonas_euryale.AAC.22